MVAEEAEERGEHWAVLGVEHVGVDEVDLSRVRPSSSLSEPKFSGRGRRAPFSCCARPRARRRRHRRRSGRGPRTAALDAGRTRDRASRSPGVPSPHPPSTRRGRSGHAPAREIAARYAALGPRTRPRACRRRPQRGTGTCRSTAAGRLRSAPGRRAQRVRRRRLLGLGRRAAVGRAARAAVDDELRGRRSRLPGGHPGQRDARHALGLVASSSSSPSPRARRRPLAAGPGVSGA